MASGESQNERQAPNLGYESSLAPGEEKVIVIPTYGKETGWGPWKKRPFEVMVQTGTSNPRSPDNRTLFTGNFKSGREAQRAGERELEKSKEKQT